MIRFIAGALTALMLAQPAFAYDYLKDVLIGNTVEISNQLTNESSRFFFNADNSVVMLVRGKPNEIGSWRQTRSDLCSKFPSQSKETCTEKPKDVSVPSERRFKGSLPDGTQFDVLIKWMSGQVPY